MSITKTTKYMFDSFKKPLLIFYSIFIFTIAFFSIISVLLKSDTITFQAFEINSLIFIFISSILFMGDDFKFLQSNGITRKKFFISVILSFIVVSVFMFFIDVIVQSISSNFIIANSIYELTYATENSNILSLSIFLPNMIFILSLYLLTSIIGMLIKLILYRSSKIAKIFIAICPVTLFIILSLINSVVDNKIFIAIANFFKGYFGLYYDYNPYIASINMLVTSIIFAGFAYLLIRKIPIKD